MNKLIFSFLIIAMTSLLVSCQSPRQTGEETKTTTSPVTDTKPSQTVCKSPRPEMCAQVYEPVCATRDTGVRCVTTPCPSTEQVTKSNACTACSDEKVFSYTEGACAI